MDRSRIVVIAAAAVSLVLAVFALGAAVSSDEDEVAAPATTVSSDDTTSGSATGGSDPATTASEATARLDIEISGFKFGPAETTVQVGTEVLWTNDDGVKHSVVSSDGGFANSPTLNQGDTYSFVFTEPGTYEYSCGFHDTMHGTITVEA